MFLQDGFERAPFSFGTFLVDRIDVKFSEQVLDPECFDFAELQAAKTGGNEKKFGTNVAQNIEVAIAVHLLCDFGLGERGKTSGTHFGGEAVFVADEIEGESPTIIKSSGEAVFRHMALVGRANGIERVSEENLTHFVSSGEARVQIENDSFDHC